jgi:glycosyltransferase involved in cell wall biosynthesis
MTEPMRILFVNPYYKPYIGGIERIIEQAGAHLLRRGEVEAVGVLTTRACFPDRWMSDLPSHERIDGIGVYRCRFVPSRIPRVFHAALAGYVSPDIASVISRFQPSVIHFTYGEWWGANLAIYLATRLRPHVLSTFFHDIPHIPSTAPLYYVNRRLIPRMDAIHTLTEMERLQVHAAYRAPLQRTVVIPPGVDVGPEAPQHPPQDVTTILAVGRLNPDKGHLELVRMFAQLRKQPAMPPLRLWLAGDESDMGPQVRALCRQEGLESEVHLFGRISDQELAALYREADIFALPTRVESFGLVFMEAMAQGLPVVAYGVGPVPSILTQGAILAPPDDETAFRAALAELIRDPERRQNLGREGHELATDRYGWSSMADRLLLLYQDVLRSHRSTQSV